MKHGGDLTQAMAEFGGAADEWLDLSTGINPWPWPMRKLPDSAWQRLPSRADEQALLAAARSAYRVPDGAGIVAANGTQALIQLLPRLATDGAVAIVGPTYSEHSAAWSDAGHPIAAIGNLAELPAHVTHAVIVNPNNPDGRIVEPDRLVEIAVVLQRRGGWLVIDEAFADVESGISAVASCGKLPVVILRSFGKFYGLAGIRLGFAITTPDLAHRIHALLGPWAVSGPALYVGTKALNDAPWAMQTRVRLAAQAIKLDGVLLKAGFDVVGGTSLYRFARHPAALALHRRLAQKRIWCRSFDWSRDMLRFGLPHDAEALDRLAAALAP
ncbi:threonine-phosphate decarboxylase [Rhodopseudomonas boonkerdii]|uniref:threonine-phosphate decarboxylase CobD n=1 Tax=Rhodopseudomonas boonkerdii TaxID=475937 RepID=UPI001E4C732E|nr:threonine-phosphate decarboxylase CobD [Rhodopseudomonas boonkerdii]UGV27564.1 threonine-phosphate decarboxylase [Rhodopseudomonas boonkerdii]